MVMCSRQNHPLTTVFTQDTASYWLSIEVARLEGISEIMRYCSEQCFWKTSGILSEMFKVVWREVEINVHLPCKDICIQIHFSFSQNHEENLCIRLLSSQVDSVFPLPM